MAVHTSSALLRILLVVTAFQFSVTVNAQLCNGSLGDPVVNITFGSGDNANTGYAPTGAYTYTTSSCPNDGFYTITTYTTQCFGNAWHTVTNDHTGGGAFMLVNASYDTGYFFVTTVSDLCPNTTYQFAAWIMNVLTPIRAGIKPNLTFYIEAADGTILGQYSTGDILETSEPTWKQYGLYFTTPANNAVITLRIMNHAPGGNGNDLALDDITFRPCGPPITASIQGNPDTVNVCEDNKNVYTFNATVSSGFSNPVYQWQQSTDNGAHWQDIPGATTLSYTRQPTAKGFYWYRLSVAEQNAAAVLACHVASNVVVINVHGFPVVSAGPDRFSIKGTPVTLEGAVTGESPEYYWSPPTYLDNDSILTPLASPPSDFGYTLFASTKYGCKANDAVQVKVVAGIFVPTAFTPNNDGKNDRWHIPFLDPALGGSVNVYNRYGQVVYHAEGRFVDWDGTCNGIPQPTGVYVYNIKFKTTYPEMKGTFLLIR